MESSKRSEDNFKTTFGESLLENYDKCYNDVLVRVSIPGYSLCKAEFHCSSKLQKCSSVPADSREEHHDRRLWTDEED